MTYEEFRQDVFQEPDTGVFIAFGDEAFENEAQLREAFEQASSGLGESQDGLAILHGGGRDVKWSPAIAQNLYYCVSTEFGSRYNEVVAAMNTAAISWENSGARINFIHASSQDRNCNPNNNNVIFDVRQVNVNRQYYARAFYPDYGRHARSILLDVSAFNPRFIPSLGGLLRHELGHVLGFRHEHTRPEARTCFENNNWRGLTPYDRGSAMHYPQCGGTNGYLFKLTEWDRQGARIAYP